MRYLILLCLVFGLMGSVVAEPIYTGKAENIQANDRGLAFTVVVKDNEGKEILRREQWVSTGVMTGSQAVSAVKNVVERMTQDMWAHKEGAKEAMGRKAEMEAYNVTCNHFVPTVDRSSPQDVRPQ